MYKRRSVKVFLAVDPGERFKDALSRARDGEGCDFMVFNDRLYPTDGSVDCGDDDAPIVRAWYLCNTKEWRERYAEEIRPHR